MYIYIYIYYAYIYILCVYIYEDKSAPHNFVASTCWDQMTLWTEFLLWLTNKHSYSFLAWYGRMVRRHPVCTRGMVMFWKLNLQCTASRLLKWPLHSFAVLSWCWLIDNRCTSATKKQVLMHLPENSRSARRAEEQIDARVAEVAQSLQQLEAPTHESCWEDIGICTNHYILDTGWDRPWIWG